MVSNLRGARGRAFAVAAAAVMAASGAMAASASALVKTFSNTTPMTIPDSGPATPYSTTIAASGLKGNVQNATVTLHGLTHTCPDDLAVLLVGPTGANSLLMANVGGCNNGAVNADLTFDESASDVLNDSTDAVTGTYRTSTSGDLSAFSLDPPAPPGPYPVNLGSFRGKPADGNWQLFILDQFAGDQGTLAGGWSLTVAAPNNTATIGAPTVEKNGTALLPVTVADTGQLTMTGKGVATIASPHATKSIAVSPGTTNLVVKPQHKLRKKLNRKGHVAVPVTVTFTPTGGTPSVTNVTVNLRKKTSKRH